MSPEYELYVRCAIHLKYYLTLPALGLAHQAPASPGVRAPRVFGVGYPNCQQRTALPPTSASFRAHIDLHLGGTGQRKSSRWQPTHRLSKTNRAIHRVILTFSGARAVIVALTEAGWN